ncbi:hypothetical protein ACS0TY_020339 [Phlomoides rotata]
MCANNPASLIVSVQLLSITWPISDGRKGSLSQMDEKVVRVPQDNSTGDSSSKLHLPKPPSVNVVAVGIFFFYYRKKQSASTVHGVKVYSYKQLEEAIRGRYIAINRLDKVEREGEKEFTTEVSAIGWTHHKNLVTLLGYCNQGQHRLLMYEYMSKGSLDAHLFCGLLRPRWNQRMQIAFGIARGLTYLHEECVTQIIHCDVKPQNILLDEFLAPKISNFGMAKLLLSEQSRNARTHIRGTIGYFAPEWFRKASITVKVDVYSFRMMLLEIVCFGGRYHHIMDGIASNSFQMKMDRSNHHMVAQVEKSDAMKTMIMTLMEKFDAFSSSSQRETLPPLVQEKHVQEQHPARGQLHGKAKFSRRKLPPRQAKLSKSTTRAISSKFTRNVQCHFKLSREHCKAIKLRSGTRYDGPSKLLDEEEMGQEEKEEVKGDTIEEEELELVREDEEDKGM